MVYLRPFHKDRWRWFEQEVMAECIQNILYYVDFVNKIRFLIFKLRKRKLFSFLLFHRLIWTHKSREIVSS